MQNQLQEQAKNKDSLKKVLIFVIMFGIVLAIRYLFLLKESNLALIGLAFSFFAVFAAIRGFFTFSKLSYIGLLSVTMSTAVFASLAVWILIVRQQVVCLKLKEACSVLSTPLVAYSLLLLISILLFIYFFKNRKLFGYQYYINPNATSIGSSSPILKCDLSGTIITSKSDLVLVMYVGEILILYKKLYQDKLKDKKQYRIIKNTDLDNLNKNAFSYTWQACQFSGIILLFVCVVYTYIKNIIKMKKINKFLASGN